MKIHNLLYCYDVIDYLYKNKDNREIIKESLEKLKNIRDEESLNTIIKGIEETSCIMNMEEFNHKLYIQFLNMNVLMTNKIPDILEQLQNELQKTNIDDFYILCSDSNTVTIAGSSDSCYYHELEIFFTGVEFVYCPTNNIPIERIRLVSQEEIVHLGNILKGYEKEGQVICFESIDSNERYYIVARIISYRWGNVYYYNRENLLPGERIADFVIKD